MNRMKRMWLQMRLRLERWALLPYTPHVAPGVCPRCELIEKAHPGRTQDFLERMRRQVIPALVAEGESVADIASRMGFSEDEVRRYLVSGGAA